MKKSLIISIVLLLVAGCSSNQKEIVTFIPIYEETNIATLLDDDVLVVEATVIDELSTKNSVVILEDNHIVAFYSLREVNIDKVLKGSLNESSDQVINVVDSVADNEDQIFEVYGGAYENRLLKEKKYVLYLQYNSKFNVYGIYDIGKAKVESSSDVKEDLLSFVTQLYFYSDITQKEKLKTIRYEGIGAWSSDVLVPMSIIGSNDKKVTFDYMYNEANDRSYFVLPSGIYYSIEGDLFMYSTR